MRGTRDRHRSQMVLIGGTARLKELGVVLCIVNHEAWIMVRDDQRCGRLFQLVRERCETRPVVRCRVTGRVAVSGSGTSGPAKPATPPEAPSETAAPAAALAAAVRGRFEARFIEISTDAAVERPGPRKVRAGLRRYSSRSRERGGASRRPPTKAAGASTSTSSGR